MNMEYVANIRPSDRQLQWQKMEFYAFAHFGMNTFTDKEWGDGSHSPSLFYPTDFAPEQWVIAIKKAKMTGLILTCKHHDGFCLWPSKYTDYSVKYSPWKEGKGDIVAEVSSACRKHGIAFGIYLSPWDRHEATYGKGEAYNTFYKNQLRELATNYGDIFCFWFDGACGEGTNGKKQIYDWQGYYAIIRELQPNAVINVCGPDVRWCGNEAGICRKSEWSVVPIQLQDTQKIAELSQQEDDPNFSRKFDSTNEDLGSRQVIEHCKQLIWYPAEVDTSIRKGWFYHQEQDNDVRSVKELIEIYYNSVGANACLLLNIPPNKEGKFADVDISRLQQLGEYLEKTFQNNLAPTAQIATEYQSLENPIQNIICQNEQLFWQSTAGDAPVEIILSFPKPTSFSHVVLQEHIAVGQRIEAFSLWADGLKIFDGTIIGYKRICRFQKVTAKQLRIHILQSRFCPTLQQVMIYP